MHSSEHFNNVASREYDIIITKPCTDDPGKFIAESSFGKKFSMGMLCEKLRDKKNMKCSESLGVAKFDFDGATLIVYRSGRIDLRKISGVKEAGDIMARLEKALEDAFEII
jgi:ArsR family metal-binding transcriptional regulator